MNKDTLQDKLKQLRDAMKQRWGALTDNDLDNVMRKPGKLASLLQSRYGYTREESKKEIQLFLSDLQARGQNVVEIVLETFSDETPEEEAHVK